MRVAYRESVGKKVEAELVLEKLINGQNMYAKVKMQVETTLDDFDVQLIQKKKFEALEQADTSNEAYNLSSQSFDINESSLTGEGADSPHTYSQNSLTHDYEDLESV